MLNIRPLVKYKSATDNVCALNGASKFGDDFLTYYMFICDHTLTEHQHRHINRDVLHVYIQHQQRLSVAVP